MSRPLSPYQRQTLEHAAAHGSVTWKDVQSFFPRTENRDGTGYRLFASDDSHKNTCIHILAVLYCRGLLAQVAIDQSFILTAAGYAALQKGVTA